MPKRNLDFRKPGLNRSRIINNILFELSDIDDTYLSKFHLLLGPSNEEKQDIMDLYQKVGEYAVANNVISASNGLNKLRQKLRKFYERVEALEKDYELD